MVVKVGKGEGKNLDQGVVKEPSPHEESHWNKLDNAQCREQENSKKKVKFCLGENMEPFTF